MMFIKHRQYRFVFLPTFFGSGDMSMPGDLGNSPPVDNSADIVCAKWG
jgi:hypothetical protein